MRGIHQEKRKGGEKRKSSFFVPFFFLLIAPVVFVNAATISHAPVDAFSFVREVATETLTQINTNLAPSFGDTSSLVRPLQNTNTLSDTTVGSAQEFINIPLTKISGVLSTLRNSFNSFFTTEVTPTEPQLTTISYIPSPNFDDTSSNTLDTARTLVSKTLQQINTNLAPSFQNISATTEVTNTQLASVIAVDNNAGAPTADPLRQTISFIGDALASFFGLTPVPVAIPFASSTLPHGVAVVPQTSVTTKQTTPTVTQVYPIRERIVEKPAEWQKLLRSRKFTDSFELAGESLKRPPNGFPSDHKFVEHLKRKDFIALCNFDPSLVVEPDIADYALETYANAQTLMRFLCASQALQY